MRRDLFPQFILSFCITVVLVSGLALYGCAPKPGTTPTDPFLADMEAQMEAADWGVVLIYGTFQGLCDGELIPPAPCRTGDALYSVWQGKYKEAGEFLKQYQASTLDKVAVQKSIRDLVAFAVQIKNTLKDENKPALAKRSRALKMKMEKRYDGPASSPAK